MANSLGLQRPIAKKRGCSVSDVLTGEDVLILSSELARTGNYIRRLDVVGISHYRAYWISYRKPVQLELFGSMSVKP